MNNASDGKPTDWKEARRLRAWELVRQSWKQPDVAAALGVNRRRGEPVGQQGPSGRHPRLAPSQATRRAVQVERCAAESTPGIVGPRAFSLRVLRRGLDTGAGGPGHQAGIRRVLRPFPSGAYFEGKGCGFSLQKPALRDTQRDADATRDWRERCFPELKKRS